MSTEQTPLGDEKAQIPKPLADVFRIIAEDPIDGLDRMTWRAAWLAAARIVEEAKPLVPPGPCWHDSGVTWPGQNFPVRCELLAGHAGAHEAEGRSGRHVVWKYAIPPGGEA